MPFWEKLIGFDLNRKRAFPGEQEGEEVVYMGVFHWMVLMPFVLKIGLAIALLVGVNVFDLFGEVETSVRFLFNTTLVTVLIHIVCFRMYNYFLKVMMITNYRLIEIRHSVFLKREREVIPMGNIQDIRYQQTGIFQRLFKYGDLIVLGSSSDVKYQFHYVPKVNKIHHILGEIHQKALRSLPRAANRAVRQAPPTAVY